MQNLNASEWAAVRRMAKGMAGIDRNELGRALAYFRLKRDKRSFLELLRRLPDSDLVRTNRTVQYYRTMLAVCEPVLRQVDNDERALAMVAWAFRLLAYEQRGLDTSGNGDQAGRARPSPPRRDPAPSRDPRRRERSR